MNKFLLPTIVLVLAISFFLLFFFLYDLRNEFSDSKENLHKEMQSFQFDKNKLEPARAEDKKFDAILRVESTLSKVNLDKTKTNKSQNINLKKLSNEIENQNTLADSSDKTKIENRYKKQESTGSLIKEIIIQEKKSFDKEKWLEYLRVTYLAAKTSFVQKLVEELNLTTEQSDELSKIIKDTVDSIVNIYEKWYDSSRSKEDEIAFRENIHQCCLSENERIKKVLSINQVRGYENLIMNLKNYTKVGKIYDKR